MTDPRDPQHPQYQKELGYAPCRSEDCDQDQVHVEHYVEPRLSGRAPRTCPRCLAKLVSVDDPKQLRCDACGWIRGVHLHTEDEDVE